MSTQSFIVLAVAVLAVGGLLGGLFIGGYELGKRNAPDPDEALADLSSLPSPGGSGGLPAGGVPNEAMLAQMQQALVSGQFQGGFAQEGGGQPGFAGALRGGGPAGGVFGTIDGVEGDVVTLSTPQGQIQVTIGDQTDIQGFAELSLDELDPGQTVTVNGQRGDGGAIAADSVFVLPEGGAGFGGGGGFGGFGGRGFNPGQGGGGGSGSAEETVDSE